MTKKEERKKKKKEKKKKIHLQYLGLTVHVHGSSKVICVQSWGPFQQND